MGIYLNTNFYNIYNLFNVTERNHAVNTMTLPEYQKMKRGNANPPVVCMTVCMTEI